MSWSSCLHYFTKNDWYDVSSINYYVLFGTSGSQQKKCLARLNSWISLSVIENISCSIKRDTSMCSVMWNLNSF